MARVVTTGIAAAALVAATAGAARAQAAPRDAYCDHVEAVAAAESAVLIAPEVFGSFGFIDQTAIVDTPDATTNDLRVTAGVRWRLGGVYQGILTRGRAKAECRRHRASEAVEGETTYRALAARAAVLDEALAEAERLLADANDDLRARRATAQEVMSTRVRVEELRDLAAETRTALDRLPVPADGPPMAGALAAYYRADAEVERYDGKLRRAAGWDVSLRVGYDSFLGADEGSPFFAVVSVGINLGWFLQGGANDRAEAARRRLVQEESGAIGDASEQALRAQLETERRRAEETRALVDELEAQLAALDKVGGDTSRRLRQTVWFELVKARAEHAYLAAHVASLEAVLGEAAGP